jgi:KaiC/GvpD/RAD55 family RecA-like ATPase
LPHIPIIEDLTKEAIPAGYNLLVEFDPSSDWFTASVTMAAGWIKAGGTTAYNVHAQPPQNIRSQLIRLGVNVAELESHPIRTPEDRLRIIDWYTATLGWKSKEKRHADSMKVADLSIDFAKTDFAGPPTPEVLRIDDTVSTGTRFNEEKAWFEFLLTRAIPVGPVMKSPLIFGLTLGVHSEWAYKTLESAVDGVIDFDLDETVNPPRSMVRIRRLREVAYDARWHPLKIDKNFEVTLDK